MKTRMLLLIFVLIFLSSCATVTKRTQEPSLESENLKLQARLKECEETVQGIAGGLEECSFHYEQLLTFIIMCSQAGESIYADPESRTLSCGKPE